MRPFSLFLLDLFFPPRCIYCDALVKTSGDYACPRCQKDLPWTRGEEALQSGHYFSNCVSAAWYEGEIRSAFLQYKFYQQRELAAAFAFSLAQAIACHFTDQYDLISWIPVSQETLASRGYDQARLLAEAVAKQLQQTAHPTLFQPYHKTPQSTLSSPQARRLNVKGCFSLFQPALLHGKRILLIDDVITTGATLEEAARILRQGGATEVLCATFCRTRPASLLDESTFYPCYF